MQIVEMKIENIQPYANNPRKNDSAVDANGVKKESYQKVRGDLNGTPEN